MTQFKTIANTLAHQLAECAEPVPLLNSMAALNLLSTRQALPKAPDVSLNSVDSIGIWQAEQRAEGKWYVRDAAIAPVEAGLWADIAAFPAKNHRKHRIVLIGESVASGFFFAPDYSLATALQGILCTQHDDFEVLDFARPDLGLEITDLLESCDKVCPDAIVFFAGNNWQPRLEDTPEFHRHVATYFATGSAAGIKLALERQLAQQVSKLLGRLKDFSEKTGIPVIPVIPEFNLKDFLSDVITFPPLLNTEQRTRWLAAQTTAGQALASGDYQAGIAAARTMISLDSDTMAVSQALLARCYLASDNITDAHLAFRKARDNEIWLSSCLTPRCYSLIQEALRSFCAENHWSCVDLPELFADVSEHSIPGNNLFLDYCHLNTEGLKLVSASLANILLTTLTNNAATPEQLQSYFTPPAEHITARAKLLAAIHNASWGQSQASVSGLLQEANDHDPDMATGMAMLWSEVAGQRKQAIFNLAYTRTVAQDYEGYKELLFRLGSMQPFMHNTLAESMMAVFSGSTPGIAGNIERIRCAEHAPQAGAIDLLETFYTVASMAHPESTWNNGYACYRAFNPASTIRFYLEQVVTLKLTVCLRIKQLASDETAVVICRVNAADPHTINVEGHGWTSVTLTISDTVLKAGLNTLELQWPVQEAPVSDFAAQARQFFQIRPHHGPEVIERRKQMARLFPVYGELSTLTVQYA